MLTTKLVTSVLVLSLAGVLAGCKDDKTKTATSTPNVTTPTPTPTPLKENSTVCFNNAEIAEAYGIKSIPEGKADVLKNTFCKYMAIQAPNGKEIEILAQSDISDEQIIRVHSILSFYLENVPGTTYGEDKSKVANTMANNGARMLLLNGSDDGTNDPTVDGQPLYDSELVVEGTAAYINNDYESHRDAAFEEILHLMHDYGIGTSGQYRITGALPAYMKEIDAARENAMSNDLWPTANIDAGATAWIEELRAEGSLSQEYLASVIDSAYGYWGANTETEGGMGGIYIAKTREEVAEKDPMGMALIEGYFSPEVTYMARIDSEFQGDFSLEFDVNFPYTYKSQYLINAQLTGNLDSNLVGNENGNILSGNSGTNTLDGKGGDDIALFKGEYAEYSVSVSGDNIIVQDSVDNRDGVVTLTSIEALQFAATLYLFEDGVLIK